MSIRFRKDDAIRFVRECAQNLRRKNLPQSWIDDIEKLSMACEDVGIRTHIAFLGTSLLAKSLNEKVDLRTIKPKLSPDNPNAYSARSLCHGALVPTSAELNFSLGANNREPLNNQPYFRMTTLDDETPIHRRSVKPFNMMLELIAKLEKLNAKEATNAFRAFIFVRRKYKAVYSEVKTASNVTLNKLQIALDVLVRENSEGGKRAQAGAAGLFDAAFPNAEIDSGLINDPSRKLPGDVNVLGTENDATIRSFEVRDKPVTAADITIFVNKCLKAGVSKTGVILCSSRQKEIASTDIRTMALEQGAVVEVYGSWEELLHSLVFWSQQAPEDFINSAVSRVQQRLIELEVASDTVDRWVELLAPPSP